MNLTCKSCREEKDEEQFYRSKNTKSGRRGKCISCIKQENNGWYKDNTDKKQEQNKAWQMANPGWRETYSYEYNRRPEVIPQVSARSRKHYLENREAILSKQQQKRIDDAEYEKSRSSAKNLRRRAVIANATGTMPPDAVLTIKRWYGDQCLVCGKEEVSLDHMVPLSKGGSNSLTNIQPLCRSCNSMKHVKIADFRPFVFLAEEDWNCS